MADENWAGRSTPGGVLPGSRTGRIASSARGERLMRREARHLWVLFAAVMLLLGLLPRSPQPVHLLLGRRGARRDVSGLAGGEVGLTLRAIRNAY